MIHIKRLYVGNCWEVGSILAVCRLYMSTFLDMSLVVLSDTAVARLEYVLSFGLFAIALVIFRFRANKRFVAFTCVLITYALLNALLVTYKEYVAIELLGAMSASILPMYLFTLGVVDCDDLIKCWRGIAIIFTLMSPIFILLYMRGFISYNDIGNFTHLNILPLGYFLFTTPKDRIWHAILVLINGAIGLVFGSRTLIAVSVLVVAVTAVVFVRKNWQYYFSLSFFVGLLILAILRIEDFLMWVISFLEHYGLRSRNISLFLLHLRGGNFESLSAGRSEIYSTVYAYVRQRYGLPAGFGVTRFITNGEYYFSHNVFLDFALVFGIWGSMVFFAWYSYRVYKFVIRTGSKTAEFAVFFLLAVPFWLRSVIGIYFLVHPFFYYSLALLLSNYSRSPQPEIGSTWLTKA